MPELPELQALAEGLGRAVTGRIVVATHVHQAAALKSADPTPDALTGGEVRAVWRRGKLIGVDIGAYALVVHLMTAGRIGLVDADAPERPRNAIFDVEFDDGRRLRLRELSSTHRATVDVFRAGDLTSHRPIARLGPEPVSLDAGGWKAALAEPSARLHTALRDGRRVAGIGRCYADEIMWVAKLAPFANTARLADDDWKRLAKGAALVLEQATDRARDRISTDLPNREARVTAAHAHYADPCLRCTTALERVSFVSYELVYCPTCQTDGRIYADRRRSRFLR